MTHPVLAIPPEVQRDPHFPLGAPLNRKPPGLRPIAGRPNWFLDVHGHARYIDPGAPRVAPAGPTHTEPGTL